MANEAAEIKKIDYKDLPPMDPGVEQVMKAEFGIAFWLSCCYFVFILAVPILNWNAPEFMKTRVMGGMSLTWFLTSLAAMAMAFIIAGLHVYLYQKKFTTEVKTAEPENKGVYH